jgi:hypothetical protein
MVKSRDAGQGNDAATAYATGRAAGASPSRDV